MNKSSLAEPCLVHLLSGELFLGGKKMDTVPMCKQFPLPFYSLGGQPASGHQGVERKNQKRMSFIPGRWQAGERKEDVLPVPLIS